MRTILSIAILAAALTPAAAPAQNTAGATPDEKNPVVLTVNGEPVRAAEISMAMGNLSNQLHRMGQQADQQQLIQMAAGRVIDGKLLAQAARKAGLQPDEQRIQDSIASIEKQSGGAERFADSLAQAGMTVEEFTAMLRDMDLAQAYVEKKIRPTVHVTEADAKAFYDANPDMFSQPEAVHARHILFKAAPDADEATKKAAREKAEKARQRALAGEDFAALARELSEGPSAKNGGDLGFFEKSQMVAPFAEAAFALQPGQISDVVETRFGYHVIKVEEHRPAGQRSFDEVKDQLMRYLEERKVAEAVNATLETLRKDAKIVDIGAEREKVTQPAAADSGQ